MVHPVVAVLDIGSNSIKVLVATRDAAGLVVPLHTRTVDARISAGISQASPRLSDEGMARGLAAIQELLAAAAPYSPARTLLVATSAVRDAGNGAEFRARVLTATGHSIRILSGEEEANGIGRGLAADPALAHLRDFSVFDLGGGSLECLSFAGRQIQQALSLQLGCVRLMEKFVSAPTGPLSPDAQQAIHAHALAVLHASGFRFPPAGTAIGTGGTVTTVRTVLGARQGQQLEETPTLVSVAQLRALLAELAPLPLERRRAVPGLPPARADVFPIAVATLIAVAEAGAIETFHHSIYNLRYGLAAELLS